MNPIGQLAGMYQALRRLNWARRPGALELLVRYLISFRLTAAGKTVLLCIATSLWLAVSSLEIPVYQLFDSFVVLLGVTYIVGKLLTPKLRVEGTFPEKCAAGHVVGGDFTVTNAGRLPAWDIAARYFELPRSIEDVQPEEHVSSLAPGEQKRMRVLLLPHKRGSYRLPRLRAYTRFPFNLWRTQSSLPSGNGRGSRPSTLLVLPEFRPLESFDVPASHRYQPGGLALTSLVGESPEYIGSREYRPGDPVRRVDFRAWARLSRPVVREYQEEYFSRVALVLDTFVPRRIRGDREGHSALEAAVSLTCAVSEALSRGESIIDLFAAGPQVHVLRSGRHTGDFEQVLELLACIEETRTNPFPSLSSTLSEQFPSVSMAVFVLLDWDRERLDLVMGALEAGCSAKVVIVRDGETTLAIEDSVAETSGAVVVRPAEVVDGKVLSL